MFRSQIVYFVLVCVVGVLTDPVPQHLWQYGVTSPLTTTPVIVRSAESLRAGWGLGVIPHIVQVAIPSQDTSRGMPQPVEDTPEVKKAKALFAQEYEKAAIASALSPELLRRRRREVMTPASTTPLSTVQFLQPSPWAHSPFHWMHSMGFVPMVAY